MDLRPSGAPRPEIVVTRREIRVAALRWQLTKDVGVRPQDDRWPSDIARRLGWVSHLMLKGATSRA